jgi:hypothetical protein
VQERWAGLNFKPYSFYLNNQKSQQKKKEFGGNIIGSTLPANKIWNKISKSLIISERIPD